MGGSSWSDDYYKDRTADKAARGVPVFDYDHKVKTGVAPRKAHSKLDPRGVVRESRDSDAHPESLAIGVVFDVTGSMAGVPVQLQKKLPQLMGLLMRKGYVAHPQVLFGAVGDFCADKVPLQIGQFESGIELARERSDMLGELRAKLERAEARAEDYERALDSTKEGLDFSEAERKLAESRLAAAMRVVDAAREYQRGVCKLGLIGEALHAFDALEKDSGHDVSNASYRSNSDSRQLGTDHAPAVAQKAGTTIERMASVQQELDEWRGFRQRLDRLASYAPFKMPGRPSIDKIERWVEQLRAPIPMFLTCPKCGARHIDEGEFATKEHHTHACQGCGLTWRPAVCATVGVEFLPGFKNEDSRKEPPHAPGEPVMVAGETSSAEDAGRAPAVADAGTYKCPNCGCLEGTTKHCRTCEHARWAGAWAPILGQLLKWRKCDLQPGECAGHIELDDLADALDELPEWLRPKEVMPTVQSDETRAGCAEVTPPASDSTSGAGDIPTFASRAGRHLSTATDLLYAAEEVLKTLRREPKTEVEQWLTFALLQVIRAARMQMGTKP